MTASDGARPDHPRITPATDPPEEVAELTRAPGLSDRPLNIFATLAHNPRMLKRFNQLGGSLLGPRGLPGRQREIVILRVGWRCRSVYEFGQHTLIGRRVGLTDEEIAALTREAADGPDWSADDRALIAMADELCADDCVSRPTWERLAQRWNDSELVELLVLAGFYRLVSGFLNSAGVALDPGVPGWPGG
ncbi:MAG TPA: carboxymuconolactone decarboxylase family protein [Acidimicrobiales bacterium]|nr:carboxymuconolactone decarboxylase family protein [Acidimicrobiales bacterium]